MIAAVRAFLRLCFGPESAPEEVGGLFDEQAWPE